MQHFPDLPSVLKRDRYMDPVDWVLDKSLALGSLLGILRREAPGRPDGTRGAPLPAPDAVPAFVEPDAQPRFQSFLSLGPHGFHRVAYTEWGNPDSNHIVVCLHGFTRNSRDFDPLAARLAGRCRVVCMDVVGRGASDWLERKDDYDYSLYLSDAAALLARLMDSGADAANPSPLGANTRYVDWVGTSMGGLIGMLLAAKPNSPIRRLVLNDVGPLIPWAALTRLRNMHLPLGARFKDLEQVENHLRDMFASFGPLHDQGWKHVARHSVRQLDDGDYVLAFDPAIMNGFNHARKGIEFGRNFFSGVDLWPAWDRVRCPTLALRGGKSDVLIPSVAREMERRGPKTEIVEFPGIGHAPWLMAEDQIGVVRDFLLAPESP